MVFYNNKKKKIENIKHPFCKKIFILEEETFTGHAAINISEDDGTIVFGSKKEEKVFAKKLKKAIKVNAYLKDTFKEVLGSKYKKWDFKRNFKRLKKIGVAELFYLFDSTDKFDNGGFFYEPLKIIYEDSENYSLHRISNESTSYQFLINSKIK